MKAALFDLDGTLLNRDASIELFIEQQYERLKSVFGSISKEQYRTRFIQLDKRGYVWKDCVYQQLVEEFHFVHITWEELLQDYLNEFKHSCVPFPNARTIEKGSVGFRHHYEWLWAISDGHNKGISN